ncbi:MAG: DUF4160 domain-containing protein [Chloroflexi bacterium]|nr:DUF4160 domain-containing protein [Chloroflexota bacterium]
MSPNVTKNVSARIRKLLDDLLKYDIITYPNDHPPAHVHFEQGEWVAMIELLPEVRVRDNYGFTESQLGDIVNLATYFREFLLDRWDELHRRRL